MSHPAVRHGYTHFGHSGWASEGSTHSRLNDIRGPDWSICAVTRASPPPYGDNSRTILSEVPSHISIMFSGRTRLFYSENYKSGYAMSPGLAK